MKSLLSLLLPESIFWRMINANPGLVSMTTYFPSLYLNLELGLACLRITRSWRPFRESADNFLGPKSYFMFAAFAFMMKVSIILIMIQWNCELTKKNWPVCVLGTVLLFDRFWFAAFAFMMKVSIILIMIQWNYQLKRKIDRFMSYRNCYYSTGLILNLRLGPKSYRAFRETDAWLYLTL